MAIGQVVEDLFFGKVKSEASNYVANKAAEQLPEWVQNAPAVEKENLETLIEFVEKQNLDVISMKVMNEREKSIARIWTKEMIEDYDRAHRSLTWADLPVDEPISTQRGLYTYNKPGEYSNGIPEKTLAYLTGREYKEEQAELVQRLDDSFDVYDKKNMGPRDLARLVIDLSREEAISNNLTQANLDVLETNPPVAGLFAKVSSYFAKRLIPSTEEYRRVSSIYNGRGIDRNSFKSVRNRRTGLIETTGRDETGNYFTLPQNTGIIFPSASGTIFMGPRSRNARAPMGCYPLVRPGWDIGISYDGPVYLRPDGTRAGLVRDNGTLVSDGSVWENGRQLMETEIVEDYFSMFHDWSWYKKPDKSGGNFNRLGDLQFISRLSQNLDRVLPENIPRVLATISYFTSVSLRLGLLFGQEYTNPPAEDPNSTPFDESTIRTLRANNILPSADSPNYNDDIFTVLGGVDRMTVGDVEYLRLRREFFEVFQEEMINYDKSDGIITYVRQNAVEQEIQDSPVEYI